MPTTILNVGETANISNANTKVIGNTKTEIIKIFDQSPFNASATFDQNTERAEVSGAINSYKFEQVGNVLNVYSSTGALVSSGPVGTASSLTLAFSDGSAVINFETTGANAGKLTVGGEPVSTATGGAVLTTPTLGTDGSTHGTGTVVGSEFSLATASVAEGNTGTTNLEVTITRTGDTTGAATVDIATTDGTATTADSDYTAITAQTVSFAAGDTTKTVTLSVTGDTTVEIDETFTASLTNATGGAAVSTTAGSATLTITNDDTLSTFALTAAIDTPTLTSSDDTIDGTTNVDSLNGDDSIIDASTTDNDTLNVKLAAIIDKADGSLGDQPTITNIENINIDWDRVGSANIDAKNITAGKITVLSTNADFLGGLTLDNLGANTGIAGDKVTSITANGLSTGTVDAGAATSASLSGTVATTDIATLIVNGDLTVTNDTTAGTKIEDLTISGTAASIVTLDAINDSVILSGDNNLTIVAAVANNYTGNTITDSTASGATTTLKVTGAGALDAAKVDVDLIDINVDESGSALTFADSANVQFSKNQTDTVTLAGTSSTDSLTLSTTSEVTSINQLDTTASKLESVLLTVGNELTVGTLTAATTLFKIKGSSDVTVSSFADAGNDRVVNASELAGKLKLINADVDNNITVKGGSGANEITTGAMGASKTFTYEGKDGGDTISSAITAAGTVKATTGAGKDTLKVTAALNGSTIDFISGAGDDTLVLETNVGSGPSTIKFDGGAGTDSFDISAIAATAVNLSGDTLTFTSVDKIVLNTGATITDIPSLDGSTGSVIFSASQLSGKSYAITGASGDDDYVNVIGASSTDDTIDLSSLVPDENIAGFFIKGDTGVDTITASSAKDVILVESASASSFDTITGIASGDVISTVDKGTETMDSSVAVDVSSVSTLSAALVLAVGTADNNTDGNYSWFQFESNTYLVESTTDESTTPAFNAADIVVKLTGLVDLSTATVGDHIFTLG